MTQLYRPPNGTAGDIFVERWCGNCARNGRCDIPLRTLAYGIDDPRYPQEWQLCDDGRPICTAFKARRERKPRARKPAKGQLTSWSS